MGLGYSHDELYPSGDWQFEGNKIVNTEPYWELYDLKNDPSEMNNVYSDPAYADIRSQLTKQLFELKEQYDDPDEDYPELYLLTKDYEVNNYETPKM